MIQHRFVYYCECDDCGTEGPEMDDPEAAVNAAIRAGWLEVEDRSDNLVPSYYHYCLACSEKESRRA